MRRHSTIEFEKKYKNAIKIEENFETPIIDFLKEFELNFIPQFLWNNVSLFNGQELSKYNALPS